MSISCPSCCVVFVCRVGSCSVPWVLPGCWFSWPDWLLGLQVLPSPGPSLGLLELLPCPRLPQILELSPFSDQPVLRLCALPYCVDCLPASSFCVPIVLNKFYSPCSFCIWVLPWQTLTEHLRKILHNFRVVQCVFLGNCHYSACPKPFPVFLSWVSAVTELVYGCQKPWLLPWQFHTAILWTALAAASTR